jgi:hypothetical protein
MTVPAGAMPGSVPGAQPGVAELAALDGLAEELNGLGFPSLRLAPPAHAPYVDVGWPGDMAAGERVHVRAGVFCWQAGEPIGPAAQPAAAAAIARALRKRMGPGGAGPGSPPDLGTPPAPPACCAPPSAGRS